MADLQLSANINSGNAPMAVAFLVNIAANVQDPVNLTVTYGDGSPAATLNHVSSGAHYAFNHTYSGVGSFVAHVSGVDGNDAVLTGSSVGVTTAAPPAQTGIAGFTYKAAKLPPYTGIVDGNGNQIVTGDGSIVIQ